jgi:lipopolysaccharide biosynthesis glycosyltransferase
VHEVRRIFNLAVFRERPGLLLSVAGAQGNRIAAERNGMDADGGTGYRSRTIFELFHCAPAIAGHQSTLSHGRGLIPNDFAENPARKRMFGARSCAAGRARGLRSTGFELRQLAVNFMKRPGLDFAKPRARGERGRYDVAVYLCADERYLKFAWVIARSIASDPHREFDVILIVARSHGVTELAPPRGCILVEADAPPVPVGVPMPAHLSSFTFARIAMVDTLLANYRRLIYLDADVRIAESLSPLCTLDLNGAPIAAVEDCYTCRTELAEANQPVVPTVEQHQLSALAAKTGFSERKILAQLSKSPSDQWRDHCARLGLGAGARYFNAGVLVIDTSVWRKADVPRRINEFVRTHAMLLFAQDQDILNGVFAGNWAELSPRWNFQTHYFGNGLDRIVQPAIYHYLDKVKPWSPCLWPYEAGHIDAFAELFSNSPWPDLIRSSKTIMQRSVDQLCGTVRRVETQHAELSAIVLKKFAADFAARRFIDIDGHEQRLMADRIEAVAGF